VAILRKPARSRLRGGKRASAVRNRRNTQQARIGGAAAPSGAGRSIGCLRRVHLHAGRGPGRMRRAGRPRARRVIRTSSIGRAAGQPLHRTRALGAQPALAGRGLGATGSSDARGLTSAFGCHWATDTFRHDARWPLPVARDPLSAFSMRPGCWLGPRTDEGATARR
jgi:hypothetical protein